jgi:hypothetical protein
VTLVPVSGLSAGIYSVRLTVTAADMTPVSLDINHQYIPTANDDIPQTKPLKAWAQNERLHVSGLTTGETWSVYSVTGMLIYHGIAAGDEADLPLSDRGVYIVKSGVQIIKVLY